MHTKCNPEELIPVKSYRDYILQAINNGQSEYKMYLKYLGKHRVYPHEEGCAKWLKEHGKDC